MIEKVNLNYQKGNTQINNLLELSKLIFNITYGV